jgi:hypothetical protein
MSDLKIRPAKEPEGPDPPKEKDACLWFAGPSEDGRYVRATAKSRSLGKLGMTIVAFKARDRWLRTAHKASEEKGEEG